MKRRPSIALGAGLLGLTAPFASAIVIPTVPIGSAGNAPDPSTGGLYGSVPYSYSIVRTEITNLQYPAFLNAVARTDTHNLYNSGMGQTQAYGGITATLVNGSRVYSAFAARAYWPVNFVSFWDAVRFANWMHNGQPTGAQDASTTEDGAYTLTPEAIASNSVTRSASATWVIPSEDEWYKAAYYHPAAEGGPSGDYWPYPTSTSSVSNALANYSFSGFAEPRSVGSYAPNHFNVLDMGGNVAEVCDTIITPITRGRWGGSFASSGASLRSDLRDIVLPGYEASVQGFRLALVPAPSSLALLAASAVVALRRRRTRA